MRTRQESDSHMQAETMGRPSRAAYQKERRKQLHDLYFPNVAEKARFEAMAARAGYPSLNAYLLQLLANASSGVVFPREYVETLQRDLERVRSWLDAAKDENADLRVRLKSAEAARDAAVALVQGGAAILARKGVPA